MTKPDELSAKLAQFNEVELAADTERSAHRAVLESKARMEVLRSERDEARSQLKEAQTDRAEMAKELGLYIEDYQAPPAWVINTEAADNHATLLGQFSDFHYGEVVDVEQMDGYNAYNPDIAILRTKRFVANTIKLARDYLAGLIYDGFVLVLGGDTVSGSIHDELERTNELSIYESVEFAVEQLIPVIETLTTEFTKLHVVSVPGNHGRVYRKPAFKGYSANNADTHIARLLNRHFRNEQAITFEIPASDDSDFSVYKWRVSAEHGHNFKSAGAPEIGSIGPLTRGVLRKGAQKLAEGKPINLHLIHHFHQLIPLAPKGYSANGSGKGWDEYARGLHLKPERPQQALMVVTPENCVTAQVPVFVSKREEEGW